MDLRPRKNRKSLAEALQAIPNFCSFAACEIEASLEFAVANLSSVEWDRMYPWPSPSVGLFDICARRQIKATVTLRELVTAGFKLSKLAKYKGFDKLVEGFENPTQFHDTIFETDAAYYCHSCEKTKSIVFSPQYIIRGKHKVPDFELRTGTDELVCECKNLHPQESGYTKRFQKIFDAVASPMKIVRIPDDIRVSIQLANAHQGNLIDWGNRIAETAKNMIKNMNPSDKNLGPFSIHIGHRHQRSRKPKKPYLVAGVVTVKDRPTPLTDTSLEMSASYFDSAIERITGSAIKKANSQLPRNKDCVIFLKTNSRTCAEGAINSRILLKGYSHVVAFGLWDDIIAFHYRLEDQQRINTIIGPLEHKKQKE